MIKSRLEALRNFLRSKKLSAFIIPSTDPHISEYPASHWESRKWISGFDGSAGTIVVTLDKAGLWTDSRYFLQAEQQLKDSTIDLFKEGLPDTPSITKWLSTNLKSNDIVGFDGCVYTANDAKNLGENLEKSNILITGEFDPFDYIWKDRPEIPKNPIFILPEKYSGESTLEKTTKVREILNDLKVDAIVIPTLDTIAWLYNIRGNDVKCNPVAIAFAYLSMTENILFIDSKKLSSELIDYFKDQNVTLADYNKFYTYIHQSKDKICLDSAKVTAKIYNEVNEHIVLNIPSPIDLLKSVKNETELSGFRNAMIKDGVALVRFFIWLEKALQNDENIEEYTIPAKLIEFRGADPSFVGESFDTICGYESNGAIVHYHVSKDSSKKLEHHGLLLIDSGGQYFDGTTDITRTVALGSITEQMKKDFTNVLKGHIQLATAIFPKGTRGSQLDILARKALWDQGLNYLHGTGHGIGHFLNVHEGPQSIRMNENPTILQKGMVTSNEPGLYRANEYGIRLENLIVTKDVMSTYFGDFLGFETITLCPFDTNCIEKDLLTKNEIEWLNNYHQDVYAKLAKHLDKEEQKWLLAKTTKI